MTRKILFTVINDLNFDQRMIRICTSLSEAGYDCVLIGRKLPESLNTTHQAYIQKRLRCVFHRGVLFYLEYNVRLFFILRFARADAVCSIDADTAMAGFAATRLSRKKWIFDAHEWFSEVPEVRERRFVRGIWRISENLAFRKAKAVYTVGQALGDYFSKKYKREIGVIRNVPVLSKREEYSPDPDRFILYQGALNQGRGLEKLISAMRDLPCNLKLAGEGDLSNHLREMTKLLGVSDKVEFLGYIRPSELKKLTVRAWIGYNVSENAGMSYYLSMNNKFFDYIHAGLPSLINNFPEYNSLNLQFHVGLLCDSDENDIILKVNLLLTDVNLHHQLHENCIKAAEVLNWEEESKKLLKIYENIFEK